MKNFKLFLIFLIVLNNFSESQQKCREYQSFNKNAYPRDQIYLLESNDKNHNQINIEFIGQNSGDYVILFTECQLKVDDIIEYSKHFPYLINLLVSDFYKNNFNKVTESLSYAGVINHPETSVEVCKSGKQREDENETCQYHVYKENKYVKLVTQILEEKHKEIFKTVLDFQPNITVTQLNVIICGRTNIPHRFVGFEINELEQCNDDDPLFMESVKTNTLAVLAPKAFDIIRPIDNPVVFYEDSYITKETRDWFRNSMTAVPWQSLKHGFLYFIKKMEWTRVAIISDSNEYSQEFENVLTTMFNENGILYMAETCVTPHCGNVINKINEKGARIIIANFDMKNMRNITPAKFRKLRKLIWITRNLSADEVNEAAILLNSNNLYNIFFETNPVDILPILDWISRSKQMNYYCDTEPCSFAKREAAARIQDLQKKRQIKIIITKTNREVGSIIIENDDIKKDEFYLLNHDKHDSFIRCTFWNKRFEDPCGDVDVMLLMVIITMFFLTVLGVVLFFQSPEFETSYRRMR